MKGAHNNQNTIKNMKKSKSQIYNDPGKNWLSITLMDPDTWYIGISIRIQVVKTGLGSGSLAPDLHVAELE